MSSSSRSRIMMIIKKIFAFSLLFWILMINIRAADLLPVPAMMHLRTELPANEEHSNLIAHTAIDNIADNFLKTNYHPEKFFEEHKIQLCGHVSPTCEAAEFSIDKSLVLPQTVLRYRIAKIAPHLLYCRLLI